MNRKEFNKEIQRILTNASILATPKGNKNIKKLDVFLGVSWMMQGLL